MTRCPQCAAIGQSSIINLATSKVYCVLCENWSPVEDWEWNGEVNRWKCGECDFAFDLEVERFPTTCPNPNCGFYHCGDDDCCHGERFVHVQR